MGGGAVVNGRAVLALDFGGTKIAAAVADATGTRLAQRSVATDPFRSGRWNLEHGIALGRRVLAEAGFEAPAAIGASTFGVPTPEGVLLAPAIAGWSDLALQRELTSAFGCRLVAVSNDVKAAASAEVRAGALAGADPALYVNLGTGLAVAIVCGGRVVSGAHGAAGEIGYDLRAPDDVERDPDPSRVLEHAVSGMALTAFAARETGERLGADEVFAREASSPAFAGAVAGFVRELCFQLVNLAVALDPERIAFGGGILGSWSRLEPALRGALEAHVPFAPELVVGAFPEDAPLVGALALALEAAGMRPAHQGEPALRGPRSRAGEEVA